MPILGYYDIGGRAQAIRFLLSYLGVAYEDRYYQVSDTNRDGQESWFAIKPNTGLAFPNLPHFVDTDGTSVTETAAVIEYVATKYGPQSLIGSTPQERGTVNMLNGVLSDIIMSITMLAYNPATTKEEIEQKVYEGADKINTYLGEKYYLLGDTVTYVDFILFSIMIPMVFLTEGQVLEKYIGLANF